MDGNLLQSLRKRLALSQDELAPKIGMTKNNLSSLENDVRGMQHDSFRRLADVAGLSIDQLREQLAPKPGASPRAKPVPDLPDPAAVGMAFVRRYLASGPLADRVRLLGQLTHAQSRVVREAIDARLEQPDVAMLPKADGLDSVVVTLPQDLSAPALPVHKIGSGHRRRKS